MRLNNFAMDKLVEWNWEYSQNTKLKLNEVKYQLWCFNSLKQARNFEILGFYIIILRLIVMVFKFLFRL